MKLFHVRSPIELEVRATGIGKVLPQQSSEETLLNVKQCLRPWLQQLVGVVNLPDEVVEVVVALAQEQRRKGELVLRIEGELIEHVLLLPHALLVLPQLGTCQRSSPPPGSGASS